MSKKLLGFNFVFSLLFITQNSWSQSAETVALSQKVFDLSGGRCSLVENPHSYACNDWTFHGNEVFPLFNMDWMGRLQGNWAMVTYADPEGNQNAGPEFSMLLTKNKRTIPAGVFDFKSGKVVGGMRVNGPTMIFENWQGGVMSTNPSTFNQVDNFTVQMLAHDSQQNAHMFLCRDFNRQKTHHLLCRWDSRKSSQSNWSHKGYIGFLRTGN